MKSLREMINIVEGVENSEAEQLARYFADLYYGDFSSTEKIRLANNIVDKIESGELSIEQLNADIDMLEKEKAEKSLEEEASPEAIAKIEQLHKD